MVAVCLYFKVHQPFRLKKYDAKEIDVCHSYSDIESDRQSINYVADNSYLPANRIIQELVKTSAGKFRVSFSISGTTLELLQTYRPDVIDSFRQLIATGAAEMLAETYYHSLSSLHSSIEFTRQVEKHGALVRELFGIKPEVFRNTELIYNNQLGAQVAAMGYKGILCEGVERILQGRSPNRLYQSAQEQAIPLLLRNARLSDDIAFRFDDQQWVEHPLTAGKFAEWLHTHPGGTQVINLFMDYETFGIHKKTESGIFDFLQALPGEITKNEAFEFALPSEIIKAHEPADTYDVAQTISWEDRAEASCVWSENVRQHNTLKKIYSLEQLVMSSNCICAMGNWGRLQSADHFYYMSHDNGKYINPFSNAAEAFHNYNNIVMDFEISLIKKGIDTHRKRSYLRPVAYNLY